MTLAIDAILTKVATTVAATTPTGSDSNAPSQFAECSAPVLAESMDRQFEVDWTEMDVTGDTGLDGQTAYREGSALIILRMHYVNDALKQREHASLVAQDTQGLMDRVERQLREMVVGGTGSLLSCVAQKATKSNEVNGTFVTMSFLVEFRDAQVTS
jgi:hypothetical protein